MRDMFSIYEQSTKIIANISLQRTYIGINIQILRAVWKKYIYLTLDVKKVFDYSILISEFSGIISSDNFS
mgnify:FL=1